MPPTTKRPGLTNDARAVLLEAVLETEEIINSVVFMRNDLRRAQFDRGRERLEAMQLLNLDTDILTDEGAQLARQLQENNARLLAGIPLDERAGAITMRGGRDTTDVIDEWHETEIEGAQAFTNGQFLMFGSAPSANRMSKPPSAEGVANALQHCLEGEPVPVFPVAYSEGEGYRRRYRIVHFSDGSALCCEIFNFITSRHPNARWTHSPERKYRGFARGFNVYCGERRVAIASTNSTDASETVQALIEAAAAVVVPNEPRSESVREPLQVQEVAATNAAGAPVVTLQAKQLPFPFAIAA